MGLETLIMGAMAAGTAVKAYGTASAGSRAQQAANITAAEIERQGAVDAMQFQRRARFASGEQRAGFAKAGVQTTTGSPLEVMLETANEEERVLHEIHRRATFDAAVTRFQGQQAKRASRIATAGTILGGVSDMGTTAIRFWPPGSSGPKKTPRSQFVIDPLE